MFTIKMQFTSKSTIHFSIFFDFSPPTLLLLSISLPYLLPSPVLRFLTYRDRKINIGS